MPMALMHAASAELGAGRVSDTDAGPRSSPPSSAL
jgi:hypothetical protein